MPAYRILLCDFVLMHAYMPAWLLACMIHDCLPRGLRMHVHTYIHTHLQPKQCADVVLWSELQVVPFAF